jgi:hypothetical protein
VVQHVVPKATTRAAPAQSQRLELDHGHQLRRWRSLHWLHYQKQLQQYLATTVARQHTQWMLLLIIDWQHHHRTRLELIGVDFDLVNIRPQ